MEAMNGIQEKQCADPFVQILARAPEGIQFATFPKQFVQRQPRADLIERLVAKRRLGGRDDAKKLRHSETRVRKGSRRPPRLFLSCPYSWIWISSNTPLSPDVSDPTTGKEPNQLAIRRSRECHIPAKASLFCPPRPGPNGR